MAYYEPCAGRDACDWDEMFEVLVTLDFDVPSSRLDMADARQSSTRLVPVEDDPLAVAPTADDDLPESFILDDESRPPSNVPKSLDTDGLTPVD